MRCRHFGRWGDSSWRKVSEALINPVIPEELAALAADSVAEAIKRQHERYWPDGTRRLYLSLHDWALAQKLLGNPPAAQELTAEMLAYTG